MSDLETDSDVSPLIKTDGSATPASPRLERLDTDWFARSFESMPEWLPADIRNAPRGLLLSILALVGCIGAAIIWLSTSSRGGGLRGSDSGGDMDMVGGSFAGLCKWYGCNVRYARWRKCQCNARCVEFQTCCEDYNATCLGTISDSCKVSGCDERYKPWLRCQCNSKCSKYHSCCPDYQDVCVGQTNPSPMPPGTLPQGTPPTPPGNLPKRPPLLPGSAGPVPMYRDPARRVVLKGVAYSPSPETTRGSLLPNDDFMSPAAAVLWGPWGRNDLSTMAALGATVVRLYGNDPSQDHAPFLDEAKRNGLSVIAGMSDWPYLQMPGNCRETRHTCFTQIYDAYKQNLLNGFTVDGPTSRKAYHPALQAMIIINEPEIGKFDRDIRIQCRVVASALDAMLQAEQDLHVVENPVSFVVTYSYASFYGVPGLGQMEMLYKCMQDSRGRGDYQPKNDIASAYKKRFVNAFNTYSPADNIRHEFLSKYANSVLVRGSDQIPVFIGEYHSPSQAQSVDLPNMLSSATDGKTPFFLGYAFFEFQARYDKAENAEHEMTFGMFGLNLDCNMGSMDFFGKAFTVHSLQARNDNHNVPMATALARAFGGDASRVDYSCRRVKLLEQKHHQ